MELLPRELREKLSAFGAGDMSDDGVALVKFFTPDGGWSWYAAEFDGDDIFYGVVDGHEVEYGSFSLRELESYRSHFGNRIERDLYFTPIPLRDLYQWLKSRRYSDSD